MRFCTMERWLLLVLGAAASSLFTNAQTVVDFPLRINAGSRDPVVDGNGITWEVDQYFTTGYYDSQNRCASNGPGPHCKIRSFNTARNPAPFGYGVPVENGEYVVTIHTIETYYKVPNGRIMDVLVEGETVFAGLDVFQEAGWRLVPFSFNVTTTVTDGQLDVHVVGVKGNPMLTGIEIDRPLAADNNVPTASPAPSLSPQPSATPTGTPPPTPTPEFQPVLINCGGPDYLDSFGKLWQADFGFSGGRVFSNSNHAIADTTNDPLYQTERYGEPTYTLDLPAGNYQVVLHFAELYWTATNKRVFHIDVEGMTRDFVDLVALGGGQRRVAFTLEFATAVSDGQLNIAFTRVLDWAKISAIEVNLVGPHLAHSVPNGPYIAVDVDNDGVATVQVDGTTSHTHGIDVDLVDYSWMEGQNLLASSATAAFDLPVGDHTISLTVLDSDGNDSTDLTTVSVFPYGYPVVTNLSPETGPITGGDVLTITGVGFTYTTTQTTVHFGDTILTGSEITIINDTTITILVPTTTVATPIEVSIETPLGRSVSATFSYINGVPIDFDSGLLSVIDTPTVARFGPDGKLYVGTGKGVVYKIEMNDDFTDEVAGDSVVVDSGRFITGIAFDPMESGVANPSVYIATNIFLHGDSATSSGLAINGDVRKLTGADLGAEEIIISGLPVSNHDHGVNGMVFGDNGDLYIQIGGNTNGGVPGELSQDQHENYYSAATIVAHLSDPAFDGTITYNSNDEPVGGNGVEVFASGIRNPFGICLHSNGYLYGTDNGPNKGYGDMLTGCGPGEQIPDAYNKDKLLLIEQGKYYGHPNPTRANIDSDARQCVWRTINENTDANYQAPLLDLPSSTNGIIEWTTNHFFGQLKGNLIMSKYGGKLYRVILEPDGRDVIPQSNPTLPLGVGANGLDVTQSPYGTLIEVRHDKNTLYYYKPKEPSFSELRVNSVFPLRGPQTGGYSLKIYGNNFGSGTPVVTVGGKSCPVVSSSTTLIECTLPTGAGRVDVTVSNGAAMDTFSSAFNFITGDGSPLVQDNTPNPVPSPTDAPTTSPTTEPPTALPTPAPVLTPPPTAIAATLEPTASPTKSPTEVPTSSPTSGGPDVTQPPVSSPVVTQEPTSSPTQTPTKQPTASPTAVPTASPTQAPVATAPLPTQPPTQTPIAAAPSTGIVALRLIHAPTNVALVDLVDGMVVNLADFGGVTPELNVQAVNVGDTVNSVRFVETARNEGMEPFAFCGDSGGDYYTCDELSLGSNTVSVIPYPGGGQSGTPFPTISVTFEVVSGVGKWIEIDGNAPILERHENCFVMVGRKAYLVGGRFAQEVDIYDPITRTWSKGAQLPLELHHMQCVAAQGKLWIVAAWTGGYPRETNAEHVYVYDPAIDSWSQRTAMPLARRRGGAATVVSADETKIYVSHGNTGGHETGNHAVSHGYLDEYTIATDSWMALSDSAPNPRDHCGGAMINGRICVAGGRNGGELGWPEVAPTDCFNLATGQWSVEADIPQVRGGSSYGTTCDGKLMVAGGEGSNKAWNQVDVFDGNAWTTINSLVVQRHGTQLAVDCVCDQIHIASGAETVGGQDEIKSVETYFPGGEDVACTL